jgi:hypothetical protein
MVSELYLLNPTKNSFNNSDKNSFNSKKENTKLFSNLDLFVYF